MIKGKLRNKQGFKLELGPPMKVNELLNVRTSMRLNLWLTSTQGKVCRYLFWIYSLILIVFQIWSFELLSPLHELKGHKGCVRCCIFSVDSTLLATGDDNGEIRVGCLHTRKQCSSCSLGKPFTPCWGPLSMWEESTVPRVLVGCDILGFVSCAHCVPGSYFRVKVKHFLCMWGGKCPSYLQLVLCY